MVHIFVKGAKSRPLFTTTKQKTFFLHIIIYMFNLVSRFGIGLVLLSFSLVSVSYAQIEETALISEESISDEMAELVTTEESGSEILVEKPQETFQISNVIGANLTDGDIRVEWETDKLAFGSLTIRYKDQSVYPGEDTEVRYYRPTPNQKHSFLVSGLPVGKHQILIESVDFDMNYQSYLGEIEMSEYGSNQENKDYLPAFLFNFLFVIVFSVLLFILYEISAHRHQFAKLVLVKSSTSPKPVEKKVTKKSAPKRKAVAKDKSVKKTKKVSKNP